MIWRLFNHFIYIIIFVDLNIVLKGLGAIETHGTSQIKVMIDFLQKLIDRLIEMDPF